MKTQNASDVRAIAFVKNVLISVAYILLMPLMFNRHTKEHKAVACK